MTASEFRAMRRECKLTQKALADLLGVTINTVSRWEVGKLSLPKYAVSYLEVRRRLDRPNNEDKSNAAS